MVIALFGPPGAGKGTQAAFLRDELGVPHVATGDIFRHHLKNNTELGRLAKSFMEKGQLVPDDVVWKLVQDRLSQDDCARGVLLDGFPRSVPQAQSLVGWLESVGRKLDRVVALEVDDAELVARLSGRRTCTGCQATYHAQHAPTAVEGVCDRCGGEVIQRKDDSEETVRARLATYARETAPVLGFLDTLGVVERVEGSGTIESITQRIRLAIG